jgi:hypothetical protein
MDPNNIILGSAAILQAIQFLLAGRAERLAPYDPNGAETAKAHHAALEALTVEVPNVPGVLTPRPAAARVKKAATARKPRTKKAAATPPPAESPAAAD